MGFSMVFYGTLVTLNTYFVKKLSLASGLMFAGGSCGQLVMPHILAYLLEQYTFRQTFVIWGACVLQMWWAASLFRPPSYYTKSHRGPVTARERQEANTVKEIEPQMDQVQSEVSGNEPPGGNAVSKHTSPGEQQHTDCTGSINPGFEKDEITQGERSEKLNARDINGNANILDPNTFLKSPTSQPNGVHYMNGGYNKRTALATHAEKIRENPEQTSGDSSTLNDAIDTVSLAVQNKEVAIVTDISINEEPRRWYSKIRSSLTEIFQISPFLAFVPGYAFALTGYLNCYIFTPGYGEDLGFSHEQVATILSVAGGADIVIRIGIGWFNTLGLIPSSLIMACSVCLGGVIIFPCVSYPSYGSTVALMVAVAIFGSPLQVLQPVTIRGFVGSELFPRALAFNQLSYGILVGVWMPSVLGKNSNGILTNCFRPFMSVILEV